MKNYLMSLLVFLGVATVYDTYAAQEPAQVKKLIDKASSEIQKTVQGLIADLGISEQEVRRFEEEFRAARLNSIRERANKIVAQKIEQLPEAQAAEGLKSLQARVKQIKSLLDSLGIEKESARVQLVNALEGRIKEALRARGIEVGPKQKVGKTVRFAEDAQ